MDRNILTYEVPKRRYEFVGETAEKQIRDKYIGKSVANLYKKGEANPIKYFFNRKCAEL